MKKYILLLSVCVLFFACEPTKNKKLKQIADLEQSALTDVRAISQSKADSLIALYESYAAEFPKDSITGEFLFRAADIYANILSCEKAIATLERVMGDFPESNVAEIAEFKIGNVYENTCKNKEKAKECYASFIEKYPKSKLATDASVLLQMLSMDNELDMIRQFEGKNTETNTEEK